jgi:hypothetical protein
VGCCSGQRDPGYQQEEQQLNAGWLTGWLTRWQAGCLEPMTHTNQHASIDPRLCE